MNKIPMTAAGHAALEGELKRRSRVERPRLVQRIQEAIADDSNLAENSEYQAAKTDQEINEAALRIWRISWHVPKSSTYRSFSVIPSSSGRP
jgi:transcription elongation GreA/GreB family factor